MSGVGHFLMMEDPEGFNHLLAQAVQNASRHRRIHRRTRLAAKIAKFTHPAGASPSCVRTLKRSQVAQNSTTLPPAIRKMKISAARNDLPVGGRVRDAKLSTPVWVPIIVTRATTR